MCAEYKLNQTLTKYVKIINIWFINWLNIAKDIIVEIKDLN